MAVIPVMVLAMGVEWLVARRRGIAAYDLRDTLTDLACGALSQLVNVFVTALGFAGYLLAARLLPVHEWAGLPRPSASSPAVWITVFLLVDFGYYWSHRISHHISFLWACHLVHHSSEQLNYAVAMRNSSLHGLFTWVFALPLAMAGVPWQVFAVCYGLNVLYQFLLHTRLVGKLGPLELVLNTPSHHRVHHGVDGAYLNRNFGAVLIVWDRWFGSFAEEQAEPRYGMEPPLRTADPVRVNLWGFAEIGRAWKRATTWPERLAAIFGPARWRGPVPVNGMMPPPPVGYAAGQMVLVLGASLGVLWNLSDLSRAEVVAATVALGVAMTTIGALLDGRSGAGRLEAIRLLALGVAGLALAAGGASFGLALTGYGGVSYAVWRRVRPGVPG